MTNLAYNDSGSGDPVLFISGTGGPVAPGTSTRCRPSLQAGYRCVTFDNRGIGETENAGGFSTPQMVADTAELIERAIGGPTRLVALSMGPSSPRNSCWSAPNW